jgi:hypothetical protein
MKGFHLNSPAQLCPACCYKDEGDLSNLFAVSSSGVVCCALKVSDRDAEGVVRFLGTTLGLPWRSLGHIYDFNDEDGEPVGALPSFLDSLGHYPLEAFSRRLLFSSSSSSSSSSGRVATGVAMAR